MTERRRGSIHDEDDRWRVRSSVDQLQEAGRHCQGHPHRHTNETAATGSNRSVCHERFAGDWVVVRNS